MESYLITGGAGFIGSALVRTILERGDHVIVLDALTYSGRRENLDGTSHADRLTFVEGRIENFELVSAILAEHQPAAVVNMAAESHVDRSIDKPDAFVETNVTGTFQMLAASRAYWAELRGGKRDRFRFLQVSTDEVYGSLETGAASEDAPYRPNSPYAATKAAADHLVRAWHKTYGLPALITHGCNTYGPRQFPEKLIPLLILKALSGQALPIYGRGLNVREWIHVDDHAAGIEAVLDRGRPGESYNLGSGEEIRNIDLARLLCRELDGLVPGGSNSADLIQFVEDRPGHDLRYFMDSAKAADHTGWRPATDFAAGLVETIRWYIDNRAWWQAITDQTYDLERLGTGERASA